MFSFPPENVNMDVTECHTFIKYEAETHKAKAKIHEI